MTFVDSVYFCPSPGEDDNDEYSGVLHGHLYDNMGASYDNVNDLQQETQATGMTTNGNGVGQNQVVYRSEIL